MEEEKPENIKKYISELEKRPTQTDLNNAIQQEKEKYKDYDGIKTELEEVKRKYEQLQGQNNKSSVSKEEIKSLNQQLQSEKEKNKVLEDKLNVLPSPISIKEEEIIKGVEKLLTDTINPLRSEIKELLKKQAINNSSLNKSPAELPTDYEVIKADKEELLKILETLELKILKSEEKN